MRAFSLVFGLAILVLLSLAPVANASVIVTEDPVTFSGGLYHYSLTVQNNDPIELLLLDIVVPPGPGVVQNIAAPFDFVATFDQTLGFATFVKNIVVPFGPTPISGFTFDSPLLLNLTEFQTTFLNVNGELGTGVGAITPAIPEPSSVALAAIGGLALLGYRMRRPCPMSLGNK